MWKSAAQRKKEQRERLKQMEFKQIKFFQWVTDENLIIFKGINWKIGKNTTQFLQHVYIKRQQEMFFQHIKNIPSNTLILYFEFCENYSLTSQDEIQSAHWVSTSCTLYTGWFYEYWNFAIYSHSCGIWLSASWQICSC